MNQKMAKAVRDFLVRGSEVQLLARVGRYDLAANATPRREFARDAAPLPHRARGRLRRRLRVDAAAADDTTLRQVEIGAGLMRGELWTRRREVYP